MTAPTRWPSARRAKITTKKSCQRSTAQQSTETATVRTHLIRIIIIIIIIITMVISGAGTNFKVGGTCPFSGLCPPLFGSTSTISRFGERFRDGQYSLVSFLFAVFLLAMPHGVGRTDCNNPIYLAPVAQQGWSGPVCKDSKRVPLSHAGFVCPPPLPPQKWARVHCTLLLRHCLAPFCRDAVFGKSRLGGTKSVIEKKRL